MNSATKEADTSLFRFIANAMRASWHFVGEEYLALGLAVIVIIRPWRDGITYPADNTYFLWEATILFTLWGVRVLLRGENIRCWKPILLFLSFFFVALLTALDTVKFDATYRTMLLWACHFFIFMLATNGLRSKRSTNIVLGAFLFVAIANTVFSIIHLKYILPYVREQIIANPKILLTRFGQDELTPALAHRLNSNRAFGSFLFPNALAAFLIVGIPYAIGEAMRSIMALKDYSGEPKKKKTQQNLLYAIIAGLFIWGFSLCVAYFIYPLVHQMSAGNPDWTTNSNAWIFYLGILPIIAGVIPALITLLAGWKQSWLLIRLSAALTMIFLESWCLWKTFSRGGMTALLGAIIITVALLVLSRYKNVPFLRSAGKVATVCVLIALTLGALGWGDDCLAAKKGPMILKEGTEFSAGDVYNPGSLKLRVTYWKTGLSMAKANFFTGVGLGNFGTVYPKYQYPGAADVKVAHNDYLQALCETGILGLITFCSFWGYFLLYGAVQILGEQDRKEQWILSGIYCGVLAFLIHSLVDFNFFNPSLAFYAFFLSGLFYARTHKEPEVSKGRIFNQVIAVPILIIAALVTGSSVRIYACDYFSSGGRIPDVIYIYAIYALIAAVFFNALIVFIIFIVTLLLFPKHKIQTLLLDAVKVVIVYELIAIPLGAFLLVGVGNDTYMQTKYKVGKSFLTQVALDGKKSPVGEPIQNMMRFITDIETLESMGTLSVPRSELSKGYRPLEKDEQLTQDTVLIIRERAKARKIWKEAVDVWLNYLASIDSIYPYTIEIASNIYQWYDMLQAHADTNEEKRRYTIECLKWAEKCIKRSPEQAWFHEWRGKSLWLRGNLGEGKESSEYFKEGLDEYKHATTLYSTSPEIWQNYSKAALNYGNALKKSGAIEQGNVYINEANEARKRIDELSKVKRLAGSDGQS